MALLNLFVFAAEGDTQLWRVGCFDEELSVYCRLLQTMSSTRICVFKEEGTEIIHKSLCSGKLLKRQQQLKWAFYYLSSLSLRCWTGSNCSGVFHLPVTVNKNIKHRVINSNEWLSQKIYHIWHLDHFIQTSNFLIPSNVKNRPDLQLFSFWRGREHLTQLGYFISYIYMN